MYGILIYDGVEPIDIGATFGVLSMARRIAPGLAFAGVARAAGEVICASGMKMHADFGFGDAPAFDDLIVTAVQAGRRRQWTRQHSTTYVKRPPGLRRFARAR